MNHEIKKQTKLLTNSGKLTNPGYAKRMHYIYNRDDVKSFPVQLKEWNFYQFQCGTYVLQLTIGHVSYMGQMAVGLIDLTTGNRWDYGTMKPFFVPKLDLNPERPSFCEFKNKEGHLTFKVSENKRILRFKGHSAQYSDIDVQLVIENDIENEKMVIATPFKKSHQFYLNYKENYYKANGYALFDSKQVDFTNATGLLDWGRGVWPYCHEWYWGSLTSHIDNVPFGFNIGWGFGDTRRATENMYFYNKKAYKFGKLIGEWDDNDFMGVKHFHDSENKFKTVDT